MLKFPTELQKSSLAKGCILYYAKVACFDPKERRYPYFSEIVRQNVLQFKIFIIRAGSNLRIGNFFDIDKNDLFLFAGPCVLEKSDINDEIAKKLKESCDELSIKYVFKASFDKANRSSIDVLWCIDCVFSAQKSVATYIFRKL